MQVVVNERFLAKRATTARLGTWGGLGILIAGFIVSLGAEYFAQFVDPAWILMGTWGAMIVGITAFNIGRYNAMRWGARRREDEIIASGLKGLDHRHTLLNYMPQTPVHHILVGPPGIYALHVRIQDGTITNQGSKWSRKASLRIFLRSMFEGAFGNPTQDAQREANLVRDHLTKTFSSEEAAEMMVQPLVIFVDARAKLTVREPAVPVLTPRDLKSYMRKQQKTARLNSEQLKRINESFGL